MPISITIREPGRLVDQQLGVEGAGQLAKALGFGGTIARKVDEAAADKIRVALRTEGVEADVYVTSTPGVPDDGNGFGLLLLLLAAAAVGAWLLLR